MDDNDSCDELLLVAFVFLTGESDSAGQKCVLYNPHCSSPHNSKNSTIVQRKLPFYDLFVYFDLTYALSLQHCSFQGISGLRGNPAKHYHDSQNDQM